MTMATRTLPLYLSSTGWLAPAPAGTFTPLAGSREAGDDWPALARALRDRHAARRVQLLLSTRLCRFQVLPWLSSCFTAGAIRARVAEAFAAARVAPAAHHVEIDWPAHGEPILAIAYPRAPVEALHAALRSAGIALTGVESSVGPVLRRHGRGLGAGPVLLAYAEDDGIAGLTLEGGRVVQVESLPGSGIGLDDVGVWSSRKQVAFADDNQLRWLATVPCPERFAGVPLAAGGNPVSAGHAVLEAWS
jgi:hypothetical protein